MQPTTSTSATSATSTTDAISISTTHSTATKMSRQHAMANLWIYMQQHLHRAQPSVRNAMLLREMRMSTRDTRVA